VTPPARPLLDLAAGLVGQHLGLACGQAVQGQLGHHGRVDLRHVQVADHVGVHVAHVQRGDLRALVGELEAQGVDQRPLRRLGRAVRAAAPHAEPRQRRQHVQHPASAARCELGGERPGDGQGGDAHLPRPEGPTLLRRQRGTERPLRVAYVDDDGREINPDEVTFVRTAAYPSRPA